jgi:hypothetical protein
MWCESNSKAQKRLQKRVAVAMGLYLPALLGVTFWVKHHPASGMEVFGLAAIPAAPVVALFVVVGLYLQEERDDFQRDIMIRGMLWGTGALLVTLLFLGFLKTFGWKGEVDPFIEFGVFWVFAAIARITYRVRNRVSGDE